MANNEIRKVLKRQWSLADHAGDFAAAAANLLEGGAQIDVQLSLASVASTAYRQGAKIDFSVDGASDELVELCSVLGAFEVAATPTAGQLGHLYMAWSPIATAANGNPGGASGADAAYTGYSANAAASILQLKGPVATFVFTAQATPTVQIIDGGEFEPKMRYGCPIFLNASGAAMHSDDVESHIIINGYVREVR